MTGKRPVNDQGMIVYWLFFEKNYRFFLWKNKEKFRKYEWIIFRFVALSYALWYNI